MTKKLTRDMEKLRKIVQGVNKSTIMIAAQLGAVKICIGHLRTQMSKEDLVDLEKELQDVLDGIKEIV